MLKILGDCLTHRTSTWEANYRWVQISRDEALQLMPFWGEQDIDRISRKLQSLGIVRLDNATLMLTQHLRFALNEPVEQPAPAESAPTHIPKPVRAAAPASGSRRGSSHIEANWQPSDELLAKLSEFHGISAEYARQLVPEFVTYWQDRGSSTFSWEARFMNHALRHWQQQAGQPPQRDSEQAITAGRPESAMLDHWQPGEDAMTILVRSGIDETFIQEAVPEFILYWRDRGDVTNTWDTRFIAHIRRQWARYESSLHHDTDPKPIDPDWQPSADVQDILRMANIDVEFADAVVAEFVVYWRDTKQAHNSWNTRFIQHVKVQWARRHHWQQTPGQGYGKNNQSAVEPDRRGFVEKHTDQSWREGL